MPLDPATFLPALLTVVGGGFLSILLARLLTLILGRVVRRTRTGADDFIVQVLGETIPPAGWVVSAALAWQIIPTSAAGDQVVFGVAKLVLVVLLVRLVLAPDMPLHPSPTPRTGCMDLKLRQYYHECQ